MDLEMTSDSICIQPESTISGTCRRAGNFTEYPEADAVDRE